MRGFTEEHFTPDLPDLYAGIYRGALKVLWRSGVIL